MSTPENIPLNVTAPGGSSGPAVSGAGRDLVVEASPKSGFIGEVVESIAGTKRNNTVLWVTAIAAVILIVFVIMKLRR